MIRSPRAAFAAVLVPLLGSVACAGNPPPVPLHADPEGLEHLRGVWRGAYESRETGRQGTIRFELSAAGDTARGDVTMIPAGRDERLRPVRPDEEPGTTEERPSPSLLGIHFVRCRGTRVQGTVEAYRDPETGHPLVTTFHGEMVGDSIGGSFSTYDQASGRRTGGTWYVLRRR